MSRRHSIPDLEARVATTRAKVISACSMIATQPYDARPSEVGRDSYNRDIRRARLAMASYQAAVAEEFEAKRFPHAPSIREDAAAYRRLADEPMPACETDSYVPDELDDVSSANVEIES